jgi:diguanylate cyclase (GGDEF)-like protein
LRPFRSQRMVALLRRPFRSLPSRIISSVFAAALVTSLAVAWMSTRSIDSFLRSKMEQRFPLVLRSTSERLALWYSQRELDLETFARSDTVTDGLLQLRSGTAPPEVREALAKYLAYVLESFPQYDALFVLAPDGDVLLRVGTAFELPASHRRRLAAVTTSQVEDLRELRGRRFQVASAAVKDDHRRHLASLHALVRIEAVEEVLQHGALGREGRVYVVGANGEVLLRSPGSPSFESHSMPLPEGDALPAMREYRHEDGSHVVGSAVRFPRFGWTIVVEQDYDDAFAPIGATIREVLAINLAIVMVFGLIAFQMARSIVRPIRALSDAAVRIGRGESGVLIEERSADHEIGVLTRTFNEMSSRLHEDQAKLEDQRIEIENANARLVAQNQELQRMNEVFQQLSITDELTRLHNHRFFRDHLPLEVKRCERTGEPLCLVLIDLDDFKKLNDRFGHAVGDAVLRKVAEVMTSSIRDMDLLARYGGEEFALLASQTPLEGALALAEKIRCAISRTPFSVVDLDGPKQVRVTASLGVAEYQGDEKAFFNDADRALYRAKDSGRDCVVVAEPEQAR